MTKKEALGILDTIPTIGDQVDALEMAIEALEREVDVSTNTPTETDYISRQAAIDALEREKTYCTAYKDGYTQTDYFKQYNMGLTDGIKALNNLPSAQRKGRWIYPTDIKGFGRCPHCKALWDYSLISNPFFKFCPRCGNGENEFAELKGEEDGN